MKLEFARGRGRVTVYRFSSDHDVRTFVIDPRNVVIPLPLDDWIEQTGGTVPLPPLAEVSSSGKVIARGDAE
jgi:hypothetical protein